MNQIKKIKFGDKVFDLVAAGVNLGESGGNITFQKGTASFDSIEIILKEKGGIAQIGVLYRNLNINPAGIMMVMVGGLQIQRLLTLVLAGRLLMGISTDLIQMDTLLMSGMR